jgi:hypothetical protein
MVNVTRPAANTHFKFFITSLSSSMLHDAVVAVRTT